jgi:hypothetical protein
MNQLNAGMRSIFQDLVERHLWPIALVLVLALIAIPVLLSSSASDSSGVPAPVPAAPASGTGSSLPAFQPVVSTEGSKSSEIRKNLEGFNSKDPFKVQGLTTGTSSVDAAGVAGLASDEAGSAGTVAGTTAGSGSSPADSGSTGTSGDSTGTTGDSTPQASTFTYYTWTASVRFGTADNFDKKHLESFRALPSSENPVVVFMGVKEDGETAVFLVSAATGTTGDGNCEPEDTCTFLYMKADQTQSFETVNANDEVVTYQLKLLDVQIEETDAPEGKSAGTRAERRAVRRAASARREGFAARISAVGF